jgi:hypothetical protein
VSQTPQTLPKWRIDARRFALGECASLEASKGHEPIVALVVYTSTLEATAKMSERNVLANQKQILKNQKSILGNQGQIKANQETIKKNQGAILKNQKQILAEVKK